MGGNVLADKDARNRFVFILVDTAHPGNIGAAARALDTMGFTQMRLVRPKVASYREDPEAIAYATNSTDILQGSSSFETLKDALFDVDFVWAASGYDREFGPAICDLRSAMSDALTQTMSKGQKIAFVFGSERSGLTNEDFLLCNAVAAIPANPERQSLNLAQAVQVVTYEAHMALLERAGKAHELFDWETRFDKEPEASFSQKEAFIDSFQEAMLAIHAFDAANPKHFMERARNLFNRAQLTVTDVQMLRGVCELILLPKDQRIGRKQKAKDK